jgi:hypothetical protein
MVHNRLLKIQSAFLTVLTLAFGFSALARADSVLGPTPPIPTAPTSHTAAAAASDIDAPLVRLDTRVVINIPSRTLWVYSGDKIVRYFPVGVGRLGFITPMGKFSVIRKVLDPGWENPYMDKGKVRIAPGETNPLGTRWIGFYQKNGGEFGIHGTDTPTSVGKFSSHGCVRMKVPDAEALFDLVDVGTPVEVVYEPVLVRRQGDNVRVIVYNDRFKKGMPSEEKIKADILKQYPDANIDETKLKGALQAPIERPVDVAKIETARIETPPGKTTANPANSADKSPRVLVPSSLKPIDSINASTF